MSESYIISRGQLEIERAAPGTTEIHQDTGIRDTTSAEQPRTPRTKSEAASATPGVAMPTHSNEGAAGSLARGRRDHERIREGVTSK